MNDRFLEHTLTYDELSQAWKGLLNGSLKLQRQAVAVAAGVQVWRDMPSFTGMAESEMTSAIDNGYVVPGMDLKAGQRTIARRRARLSETEGELQVDLAIAGHDRPFLHRPKVKRQAGLTINFELAMRASTPASVLTDYAQWMASLVAGLQSKGFDLELNITSRARGVAMNGSGTATTVKVKRFGRRSDLKSWGAMLSPGGFRHLIFCARILTCEANGVAADPGFGGSFGPKWGLEYDPKARVLNVKVAAETSSFPKEQLDAELAALSI